MVRGPLFSSIFLSFAIVSPALAIPPPCSEEELLATSDYAIEGYAIRVDCGEPRDSGECLPQDPPEGYLPEAVSDCTAAVKVTASLKGSYTAGDEVEIPFLKLVRACRNGLPIDSGSPRRDIRLNSKVRFFNSEPCAHSSFSELEAPFFRGDPNKDGMVDISDAVMVLFSLFGSVPVPSPLALDADGSGTVDLTDAVRLLEHLFLDGPPPPDPVRQEEPRLRLTIAYDNYLFDPRLGTDWGFSCILETPEKTLCVDTGGIGTLLLGNLAILGLEPERIDALLFTHVHPDHIGAVASVLGKTSGIPVYIPKSFPASFRTEVKALGSTPVDVTAPFEVFQGIASSGEIKASPSEQFLMLRTERGLVVIVACAHPGIVPVVEEAKRQSGEDPYLVLGGYHLFQSTDSQVRDAIASFRDLKVKKVALCHCSGERARELFKAEYGKDYVEIGAGAGYSWRR